MCDWLEYAPLNETEQLIEQLKESYVGANEPGRTSSPE